MEQVVGRNRQAGEEEHDVQAGEAVHQQGGQLVEWASGEEKAVREKFVWSEA